MEINGNINEQAVHQAIHALFARHEILRTSFPVETYKKTPSQVVADVGQFSVTRNYASFDIVGPGFENGRIDIENTSADCLLIKFHISALYADRITAQIVFTDFVNAYRAACDHIVNDIDRDAMQYVDFSEWQGELMRDPDAQRNINYWKDKIKEIGSTSLLCFEKGAKESAGAQARLEINLEEDTQGMLRSFETSADVELPNLILFTWALLIDRLGGGVKTPIGYVHDGRTEHLLAKVAGPFSKILPLFFNFDAQGNIAQHRAEFERQLFQDKVHHEYFSLDKIVDVEQIEYFPFLFEFRKEFPDQNFGQTKFRLFDNADVSDIFRLKLDCLRGNDTQLHFSLLYNSDHYDETTVLAIANAFQGALMTTLAKHNEPLRNVSFFSGGELSMLNDFAFSENVEVSNNSILKMFDLVVKTHSQKPAIVFNDTSMSYDQLDELSTKVASYLRSQTGNNLGDLILVQMKNSDKLIVVLLGIIKAGFAYVPVDAELPAYRLNQIIEDSNCCMLIADQHTNLSRPVLSTEDLWKAIVNTSPLFKVLRNDNAYCIYTSGSTGRPKGVLVGQKSLVNYVHAIKRLLKLDNDDRFLLCSSAAFDLGYTSLWVSLLTGNTLIVADSAAWMNGVALLDLIIDQRVSIAKMTPSHFKLIVEEQEFNAKASHLPIRYMILGGEKPDVKDIKKYWTHKPATKFVNHYGPTEATVGVIANHLFPDDIHQHDHNPIIGRPLANNSVIILGEDLHIVPLGVYGELYIAGENLALGYLNNPRLTFAKFITLNGQQYYRTGDIGRWLPNGKIQFVGRSDDQVKIRGYRVELNEISNCVKLHPLVTNAIALFTATQDGDHVVKVYFVSSAPNLEREIRSKLEHDLPSYMIPSEIFQLSEMPLTPNGKIDRNKLQKLTKQKEKNVDMSLPIADGTLGQLVDIWEQVLGKPSSRTTENFFEQGGHSLKAVKLRTKIQAAFGIKIDLKKFFDSPTIETLAQQISESTAKEFQPIERIVERELYSASHAQIRIWLSEQHHGKDVYVMHWAYKMSGVVERTLLEQALISVINRHESLRTNFVFSRGALKQKIRPSVSGVFKLNTSGRHFQSLDDDSVQAFLTEHVQIGFDLENEILVKATLVPFSDETHLLLLKIHHVVSDEWSMNVFVHETITTYNALLEEKVAELPSLPIQYKDYSEWHNRQCIDFKDFHQRYWRTKLSGNLSIIDISDIRNGAQLKSAGCTTQSFIDVQHSLAIRGLTQNHKTTLFSFLLSCLNLTLLKYAGTPDILVCCPTAGRSHPSLENQIGFYVNILPLRTQLNDEDSFTTVLKKTSSVIREANEHDDYPFDELVKDVANGNVLRQLPYNIVVSFQQRNYETQMKDVGIEPVDYTMRNNVPNLKIVFAEQENQIAVLFDYKIAAVSEGAALKLKNLFISIVEWAVKDPTALISTAPTLPAESTIDEALGVTFNF